jgi:hypothetical protein
MKKPVGLKDSVYYTKYINLAEGTDLVEGLNLSFDTILTELSTIDEEKSKHKYGDDKWTIKQVVQHFIDVERLFVARALSIARDVNATIVTFDDNLYASNDYSNTLKFEDIITDFKLARQSTISFFKTLNTNNIDNQIGDKIILSPRIIGWLISGHSMHHLNIIKERYL